MAEYQTKSSDCLSFDVIKDNKSIGKLSYKSWFRFNAMIETEENIQYHAELKGFWGTKVELRESEKLLLRFEMNWNGDIAIQTFFKDFAEGYIFKHRGILKESFALTDQHGAELLVMKPHLKWRLMNYEYQITTSETFEVLPQKDILLLNSLHCANYYMSMIANAVGI